LPTAVSWQIDCERCWRTGNWSGSAARVGGGAYLIKVFGIIDRVIAGRDIVSGEVTDQVVHRRGTTCRVKRNSRSPVAVVNDRGDWRSRRCASAIVITVNRHGR
jgi:hypothetical protein